MIQIHHGLYRLPGAAHIDNLGEINVNELDVYVDVAAWLADQESTEPENPRDPSCDPVAARRYTAGRIDHRHCFLLKDLNVYAYLCDIFLNTSGART